jgi:D-alanyl-D-alanine carboxypeptidase
MMRKNSFIFFLIILLASCGNDSSKNTGSLDDADRISRAVDYIMMDMPVPGVLLYLYVPGRLNLLIMKGMSDIATRTPVSPDLIFRIGSISKTFTAVTVLQLAGEHRLSLEDKLSKYESRTPNADAITLRMMLNHTCGIFSYTNDENFVNAIKADPLKKWTYDEIIDIVLSHPAEFFPGTGFGYSNTAYFILGKIIEAVTGNRAGDEIRTRIIDRLGLENTGLADAWGRILMGTPLTWEMGFRT